MSRITNLYYGEVDSVEFSCFIYFTTNPPIPADAEFFANVNGSWKIIFPNEINPGEYYQRIFDLQNGDNSVQIRIDYLGETFTSDPINVLVEGEEPEITPPRVPTPPVITTHDVSVTRRVPCIIEYTISTIEPVIHHWFSDDEGKTWQTIEPTYDEGLYSFTKYYSKAGEYKVYLKCMNNYWDESDDAIVKVTITKGEGDEPGYHITDTEDFVLQIAVPEAPPEPETPTLYYVVNAASYTDYSMAIQQGQKLEAQGYTVFVEQYEN